VGEVHREKRAVVMARPTDKPTINQTMRVLILGRVGRQR
jgi:hypothetical protein